MRYLLTLGVFALVGPAVVVPVRLEGARLAARSFYGTAGPENAGNTVPQEKQVPPVPIKEAESIVRELIFTQNPRMNPTAEFPLKEITTQAIRDRLDVQVFQVTEGVQAAETFVIKAKKAYRIGQGFGGQGVTSLAVADPSTEGRDKLIFAFSWGSGIHRSQVAIFDVLARDPVQVVAPEAYFGDRGDLAVKAGKEQTVEVYAGKEKVGRLQVEGKEKELKVSIQLCAALAEEVKNGFRGEK